MLMAATLSAGWLLCACALSAQTVTVTGSITNAITHEPIEGVSVILFAISGSAGANSDASGRFRIPNVKPGGYQLARSRVDLKALPWRSGSNRAPTRRRSI
jgi:hypothetical protein